MPTIAKLLDSDGSLLFDLNDPTGANNPYGAKTGVLHNADIGAIDKERTWFESEHVDGGKLIHKRLQMAQTRFRLFIQASSSDNLINAVGRLGQILDQPGQLEFQANAATRKMYLDFEDGEIPTLLRGQDHAQQKAFLNFLDTELPIVLHRQSLGRLDEIDSDSNRLVNPALLRAFTVAGRPDSWTWLSTTDLSAESINAALEAYQFTFATASERALRQVVSEGAAGETWTFAYDGSVTGTGRVRARIVFLSAADAILQTNESALVAPAELERLSITGTAPASTAKVRAEIVCHATSAAAATYRTRRAMLEQAATPSLFVTSSRTLSMDPISGGRFYEVYNPGDAPAPVSFRLTGDTGAKIQSVTMMARSAEVEGGKSLARLLNGGVLQCEDATITGGTGPDSSLTGAVTADANASGGNTAKQSIGTSSAFGRLYRWTISDPAVLEGLRGPLNVRLRQRLAGKKQLDLQLRWAASLEEPAPISAPIATHNTNLDGLATFGYVETDLGRIHLPESGPLSGLALEVYGRDAAGLAAQDHFGDVLMLTPVDQRTSILLPYTARTSRPGSFSSGTLGVNRWRVVFKVSIINPAALLARFRIRRTGVDHVIREITYTQDHINTTVELEFDSDAGQTYLADVITVSGTGTITVHEVSVERVTVIGANQQLVSDPSVGVDEVKILTATGQDAGHASPSAAVPFYLPPGLSLVWVAVEEPRIGGQYSELASNLARAPQLAHSLAPRVRP